jgi:hypothetical protein
MTALANAYKDAPFIVIDMLVTQEFMTPEKAVKAKKKLREAQGKPAGGKSD